MQAFSLTSFYDSLIANYFKEKLNADTEFLNVGGRKLEDLRYGENPAQSAAVYGDFYNIFKKFHGKDLSYNNIIDIDASAKLILEFEGENACAIIKHTNPSGVGIGENLKEAYLKAFATDNVSPFGGIFCFNQNVNLETAEEIHKIFSEVIIAPSYDDDALELLKSKKDRRLVVVDLEKLKKSLKLEIKSVSGGFITQDYDKDLFNPSDVKTVTKRETTEDEYKSLMFAWKVAKHVKSNAIVYCAKDRTLGVGAGQMSRVDSARIAREKAKQMGLDLKGSVLASDAFFPFADGLEMAAEAGSTAVIQPGGSIRDNEVIEAADKHNIAMVFTGSRHFKH
jgi:phosphoribosylaminoimidazolecarboxamide formyltransferase/IMP cyclohydrolase